MARMIEDETIAEVEMIMDGIRADARAGRCRDALESLVDLARGIGRSRVADRAVREGVGTIERACMRRKPER